MRHRNGSSQSMGDYNDPAVAKRNTRQCGRIYYCNRACNEGQRIVNMSEINLLQKQDPAVFKKQKTLKMLRRGAYLSLSAVAVFSVILFLLRLGSPLDSLLSKENQLKDQMSKESDRITQDRKSTRLN